jgi:hypothetical protein
MISPGQFLLTSKTLEHRRMSPDKNTTHKEVRWCVPSILSFGKVQRHHTLAQWSGMVYVMVVVVSVKVLICQPKRFCESEKLLHYRYRFDHC